MNSVYIQMLILQWNKWNKFQYKCKNMWQKILSVDGQNNESETEWLETRIWQRQDKETSHSAYES